MTSSTFFFHLQLLPIQLFLWFVRADQQQQQRQQQQLQLWWVALAPRGVVGGGDGVWVFHLAAEQQNASVQNGCIYYHHLKVKRNVNFTNSSQQLEVSDQKSNKQFGDLYITVILLEHRFESFESGSRPSCWVKLVQSNAKVVSK